MPEGSIVYDCPTTVAEPSHNPNPDYRFVGWFVTSTLPPVIERRTDLSGAQAATWPITMDDDHDVTAVFIRLYNLTIGKITMPTSDDGGTVDPDVGAHIREHNEPVTITATPYTAADSATGYPYRFKGWYFDNVSRLTADEIYEFNITADFAVAAVFVRQHRLTLHRQTIPADEIGNTYSARPDPCDSTPADDTDVGLYDYGTDVEIEAPVSAWRYRFGWYEDPDRPETCISQEVKHVLDMTKDYDLTGLFVKQCDLKLTKTTDPAEEDGGEVTRSVEPRTDTGYYDYETEITVKAQPYSVPDHGYWFWKWTLGGEEGNLQEINSTVSPDSGEAVKRFKILGDVTLNADFVRLYSFVVETQTIPLYGQVPPDAGGRVRVELTNRKEDMPHWKLLENSHLYPVFSRFNLSAEAGKDYHFRAWEGTFNSEQNPTSIDLTINHEIAGVFINVILAKALIVDQAALNDPAPGNPDASDPLEDGSLEHPFDTLQEAIDAFVPGKHSYICMRPGAYPGNNAIAPGLTLHIIGAGEDPVIIDGAGQPLVAVDAGPADKVTLEAIGMTGAPTDAPGGALFILGPGGLTLFNSVLFDNGPDTIWLEGGDLNVRGTVYLKQTGVGGQGSILVEDQGILALQNGPSCCNIAGLGDVHVPGGHCLTLFEPDPATVGPDVFALSRNFVSVGQKQDAQCSDCVDGLDLLPAPEPGTTPDANTPCLRMIAGQDGSVYMLDSESGLYSRAGEAVLTPAVQAWNNGRIIVGPVTASSETLGLPILDACVTKDSFYITPVLVEPNEGAAYTAVVRVSRSSRLVEQIYASSCGSVEGDGASVSSCLREIELGATGTLYVLSKTPEGELATLCQLDAQGQVLASWTSQELGMEDPLALHWCSSDGRLYMASGRIDPVADHVLLFGLNGVTGLMDRWVTIENMHRVTGISSQSDGTLWVCGFWVEDQDPSTPDPSKAGHQARYAIVKPDVDTATAQGLPAGTSGLPTSIVWLGRE